MKDETITCDNCGVDIPISAKICYNCGSKANGFKKFVKQYHFWVSAAVGFLFALLCFKYVGDFLNFIGAVKLGESDNTFILLGLIAGVIVGGATGWLGRKMHNEGKKIRLKATLAFFTLIAIAFVIETATSEPAKNVNKDKSIEQKEAISEPIQEKEVVKEKTPEAKPSISVVGKWNPVVDNMDEYEPYMLEVKGNGTYTIVAEDEANNIEGKWKDHGNGSYLFVDGTSFLSGIVTIEKKSNQIELVVVHAEGKNSRFTLQ